MARIPPGKGCTGMLDFRGAARRGSLIAGCVCQAAFVVSSC